MRICVMANARTSSMRLHARKLFEEVARTTTSQMRWPAWPPPWAADTARTMSWVSDSVGDGAADLRMYAHVLRHSGYFNARRW